MRGYFENSLLLPDDNQLWVVEFRSSCLKSAYDNPRLTILAYAGLRMTRGFFVAISFAIDRVALGF